MTSQEDTNILLLAFDGLSKRHVNNKQIFLDQFNDDYFEKHMQIDLGQRPIYFTSELFTDLATGVSKEEHGVEALKKFTQGKYGLTPHKMEMWLWNNMQEFFIDGISFFGKNFLDKEFRTGIYNAFLDSRFVKYERSDIQVETIFETYDNAIARQYPVYDWRRADVFHHLKGENRQTEKSIDHIKKEWKRSKDLFWNTVEEVNWSSTGSKLYAHHFHYIDWMQHIYVSDQTDEGVENMTDDWFSANNFLEKVKQHLDEIDQDVELVVMSDHGLPRRYLGHEPDAFVSSTIDIFPENPTLQEMNMELSQILENEDQCINL